jgi:hypothetical protein
MSAVSTAATNLLLKGYFGSLKITGTPATLYVGVSGTTPSMTAGVISGVTEPSNGSYARVGVTNNDTYWAVASREASNVSDVTFVEATAEWDQHAKYWVLFDASTAGNIVAFGDITSEKIVYSGVTLVLDAGECVVAVNE